MRLKWEYNQDGSCYGQDPERPGRSPTATVEKVDPLPDPSPWCWFIADFPPIRPKISCVEFPAGNATSKEEAMNAAENAYPTPEQESKERQEADEEWQAYNDAKMLSHPNN